MPRADWDSVANRFLYDTLPATALAPTAGNDLCNKAYVDLAVGGAALFMSQYANPQAAVDAAIASGVNAVFVDDVFTITVPVNLNSAGLALIGLGMDTGFIVNDAAATGALNITAAEVLVQNIAISVTNAAAAAKVVLVNGVDDVKLRGVRVDVPGGVVVARAFSIENSDNCQLLDCYVEVAGTCTYCYYVDSNSDYAFLRGLSSDAGSNSVYLDGPRSLMSDGVFLNAGIDAVTLNGGTGKAINVRVRGAAGWGFNLTGAGETLECCRCVDAPTQLAGFEQHQVFGCYLMSIACVAVSNRSVIDHCIVGGLNVSPIIDIQAPYIHVQNCTLVTASFDGIGPLLTVSGAGDRSIIQNNRLYTGAGTLTKMIEVAAGAVEIVISNNMFDVNAAHVVGGTAIIELGAGADRCIITGNEITDAPIGISLLDNDDCTIAGNNINSPTGDGINLAGNSARCTITGNTITGGAAIGIDVVGTHHSIVGNTVNGGTTGISLAAGVDSCVVGKNVIYNFTADGIYLADCDYCAIDGNNIDTCGDTGIDVDGNSIRNQIGCNVTRNCTTEGLNLADTTDFNLVTTNQFPDGFDMGAGADNEDYHNID